MTSEKLVMHIQPKIIDHLGINMYTNLHAVVSELIANSWDADANNVWITIPAGKITKNFKITIKDDGIGMNFKDLNALYLQVGRNKRIETGDQLTPDGRRTLGKKGIGKFAVFGVARKVFVTAVRNHHLTKFRMDIDKIKAARGKYFPNVIGSGKTTEPNGVIVELTDLKRKNRVDLQQLREGLANRFMFLGTGITVYLNDEPITDEDARMDDIEYIWPIDEAVSATHLSWKIKGTVWAKKHTIREIHNRGVALYARGKLVQEPTYFGTTSGKEYAYDHIFGKLEAEFLDSKQDIIGTNRSSINLESEEGQAVFEWGKKKLTQLSIDWAAKRVAQRTAIVTNDADFKDWFEDLTPTEQKRARKVFDAITKNENLPEEKVKELAGYVRDTFQFSAFQDLAQEIEDASPDQVPKIIELFKSWEHLEAKEMYRIFQGRISTMDKLEKLIATNAREVPTIHQYLTKFPWMLDARWTIVENEVTYTKLLKKHFPEGNKPAKNRRLDFFCFSTWPALIVVELKRPGYVVGAEDLEQLMQYCIFVEENKGTDPQYSRHKVFGYLVCENEDGSKNYAIRKDKLSESGIFVRKYSEILSYARRVNDDFISRYKEIQEATSPRRRAEK